MNRRREMDHLRDAALHYRKRAIKRADRHTHWKTFGAALAAGLVLTLVAPAGSPAAGVGGVVLLVAGFMALGMVLRGISRAGRS